MLNNDRDHWADLVNIVNVLANLGEGHDTSVLVPPVSFVSDGVLDELSN